MVAQIERRFIKERQREGIARAKAEGIYASGKRRLDRDRIKSLAGGGMAVAEIARSRSPIQLDNGGQRQGR